MKETTLSQDEQAQAFLKSISIYSKKEKRWVNGITLYPPQEIAYKAFLSEKSQVILKARQMGMSTATAIYHMYKLISSKDPITVAIVSHKIEASKEIFKMYMAIYQGLRNQQPDKLKGVATKTSLKFKHNGAELVCLSSQSEGGLRSYSINYAHITEFAFQEGAEEMLSTVIPALHSPGQVIIESTAKAFGDPLYNMIQEIKKSNELYDFIFLPWHTDPTYKLPVPPDFIPTSDELQLVTKYNLTHEQLMWRRNKIQKFSNNLERFQREYPASELEAYESLGTNYFPTRVLNHYKESGVLFHQAHQINYYRPPEKDKFYCIGVDTAAGVGGDNSAVYVLDEDKNIAAMYYSNKIIPSDLAQLVFTLGRKYNNAVTLIESNNFGGTVIELLKQVHNYGQYLWHDGSWNNWTTTAKSKIQLMENIRNQLNNMQIPMVDSLLLEELHAWVVSNKGIIYYPSNLETHGDNTVALALALIAHEKIETRKYNRPDPMLAKIDWTGKQQPQYAMDNRYR